MDGTREPLSDEILEREIETALDIEPSPEFLARVRTRVSAEGVAPRWYPAFPRHASVALAGVVVLAIAVAALRSPTVDHPSQAAGRPRAASQASTGTDTTRAPEVRDPQIDERPQAALVVRRAAVIAAVEADGTVPLRLSSVMVSDSERHAFERFVSDAGQGQVPKKSGDEPAAGESLDIVALKIEPFVIDPLPPLARVEYKGEGQW
jgi:hypothetical protein